MLLCYSTSENYELEQAGLKANTVRVLAIDDYNELLDKKVTHIKITRKDEEVYYDDWFIREISDITVINEHLDCYMAVPEMYKIILISWRA